MVLAMVTCNGLEGSSPASVRFQNTVIGCFKGNDFTFHLLWVACWIQWEQANNSFNDPGVSEGARPVTVSTAVQREPMIISVRCGGQAYLLETVEVTLPSLFCFWLS